MDRPAGSSDERRVDAPRGTLLPVLVLVVVGIVLALVVTVLLQSDGAGEGETTTTDPVVTEPVAGEVPSDVVLVAEPGSDTEHELSWTAVGSDLEYEVTRFTELRPGEPEDIELVQGTRLRVTTVRGLPTCFEVRVAGGDPRSDPKVFPDACTEGTSPLDVLVR